MIGESETLLATQQRISLRDLDKGTGDISKTSRAARRI